MSVFSSVFILKVLHRTQYIRYSKMQLIDNRNKLHDINYIVNNRTEDITSYKNYLQGQQVPGCVVFLFFLSSLSHFFKKTLSENKEMWEKMPQIGLNINRKSVFFGIFMEK